MKFAVVYSAYYTDVVFGLLVGAKEALNERGIRPDTLDHFQAPGAFEIPLIAREAAKTGRYAGIICLGCVVKGDTAHFEYIAGAAATGLQQASLETGVPMSFGILTVYEMEQALLRCAPDTHNKGREAAAACFEAAWALEKIRKP